MKSSQSESRRGASFPVAFIPGVGHLDYVCGASNSVFLIGSKMSTPVLTILEDNKGIATRYEEEGIPYTTLRSPVSQLSGIRKSSILNRIRFGWIWIRYASKLFLLLKKHRVKVVYTANTATLLAAWPTKLAGAKLIAGFRADLKPTKKWRNVISISDRVVTLSHEMADSLKECLPESSRDRFAKKALVIPNGIDLAKMAIEDVNERGVRTSLGLPDNSKLVLYVAGFREWKGQLKLIETVIPAVLDRDPNAHFVFLGDITDETDRPYFEKCIAAAEVSGGNNIHFCGFVDDLWPWYAAADLLVLASEKEGMPRCVIEAMAFGLPVATYEVSSVRDLLAKTGAGIVVDQGDTTKLADAVVQLCRNTDLRASLGKKGKEHVEQNLDIQRIAELYDCLAGQLLSESGD